MCNGFFKSYRAETETIYASANCSMHDNDNLVKSLKKYRHTQAQLKTILPAGFYVADRPNNEEICSAWYNKQTSPRHVYSLDQTGRHLVLLTSLKIQIDIITIDSAC